MKDTQYKLNSYKPLYSQIKTLLIQNLICGEWRAGEMIPSEFELAERYKVSQGTARRAIESLSAENIVIRRQGRGTFVAIDIADGIKQRFLRLTSVDGKKELLQSELISYKKGKADEYIGRILGIKVGASTIEIKRLLTFSGVPLIYDCLIVPATSFKGLNVRCVEKYKGSMYGLYDKEFGVYVMRTQEHIKAVVASGDVAKALGLKENEPLLSVERISFTYGNQPIEWRLGLCVTDNHHYINELD